MAFFDNIGKKASEAGARAIQKTKEISDVTKLNSMISDEEKKIANMHCQIGTLYVSLHRADCEEAFAPMIAVIVESEGKVDAYRKQIQEIKGMEICENCGAEVAKGAAFCSVCGTQLLRKPEPVDAGVARCMGCGAPLKAGTRFCTACGKPVSVMAGEQAPADPVPAVVDASSSGFAETAFSAEPAMLNSGTGSQTDAEGAESTKNAVMGKSG